MLYRPQFAYPTPRDCRDEQFSYSFDSFNVPLLGQTIIAGAEVRGIPLVLQTDAPFYWRGVKFSGSDLSAQLQDAYGNKLSEDYLPLNLYGAVSRLNGIGGLIDTWEPERVCPAGAVIILNLKNTTSGTLSPGKFTLLGAKRLSQSPELGRCQ